MQVKFKQKWFAPTESIAIDKTRHTSGQRYDKGVQEVPSELREFLPKTAVIVDGSDIDEEVKKKDLVLQEMDHSRASGDQYQESLDTATEEEAERQRKLHDKLEKARASKAAKRAARLAKLEAIPTKS